MTSYSPAVTSYSALERQVSYHASLRRAAVRQAVTRTLVVVGALLAGAGAGLLPLEAVALGIVIVLAIAVWRTPALGAYLVMGLTPLTTGIDRGTLIPVLRPNEALLALVGGVLFARWLFGLRALNGGRVQVDTVLGSILALALTSSVVPLVWLALRNEPITSDDLLYTLVIWKYLGVFLLVRSAVRTAAEIRWCLLVSIGAAVLVAIVAVLQSRGVGVVINALSHYYVTNGNVDALSDSRGSSTLTLPIAVADLMVFNLAIIVGMWLYARMRPVLVVGAACMIVAGTLAAAEFSGVLGLAVGVLVLLVVTQSGRLSKITLPGLMLAVLGLWPVIHVRLLGFQSTSGLPVSWTGRLFNLRNYFWPVLREGNNYLLGVRPAARIPAPHRANGFIWIESGYTWLLWAGGIPLLLAFIFFVVSCWRVAWSAARHATGSQRVAGLATVTALAVMTVLMSFDPHLTYRGSADALFALIALTVISPHPAPPNVPPSLRPPRPEVIHVHV